MNVGYGTVSYRHESFKRDEAPHAVAHSIRSLEEREGVFKNHSNEMIDPKRTASNEVFYFEDGEVKFFDSTAQVYDRISSRLNERWGRPPESRHIGWSI